MVAPTILWRYILREVVVHTLLGLLVFSLVLIGQNVIRLLEALLAAGISIGTLAQLVAIALPSYLAYAVPTSLLFGVLITFGRLSADGEVVAMRAAGVNVPLVLPPVVAVGAVCAAFTAFLLFDLEPASRYRLKSMVKELARTVDLIEAGKFRSVGTRTVYVADRGDETCPYEGVLIGDLSDAPRPIFISARCGQLDAEASSGLGIELRHGSIHFSQFDADRYRKISFESMRIDLDIEDYLHSSKRARDYRYRELLELKQRFANGEEIHIRGGNGERSVDVQLHRRVAFSLAPLLLGLLAVPLGVRPVRAGRSAGALTAILMMGLYWLISAGGELAAEEGHVPVVLGVWLANALVTGLTLAMIRVTIRGDS